MAPAPASFRFKFLLLLFLVGLGIWSYYARAPGGSALPSSAQTSKPVVISEKAFSEMLANGQIKNLEIVSEQMWAEGILPDGNHFRTLKLSNDTLNAASQKNSSLEFQSVRSQTSRLTIALFICLLFFGGNFLISSTRKNYAIKRTAEGNMVDNPIKDSLKDIQSMQIKTHFSDVAGIDEVIEELAEIVAYLKDSSRFTKLGAKIPRGVLLHGLPGTGKTLVAKAVAGEAGVPFYSISGSGFIEMYAGVGASRVRKLFAAAKKNAPCIIFIDEIDALGKMRAGALAGNEERDQTLNQLLVEMDGFDTTETIVVIGATNRLDILDPALLRPGRFDRHIAVQLPGYAGRVEILTLHTRNKPLAPDVDINVLAQRTQGLSGADLANLANEAALLAAKNDREEIYMHDFIAAIERVVAGQERKNYPLNELEKKIIAYHEGGHALTARILNSETDQIQKISIVPRGSALGYVMQAPREERHLRTKSELLRSIIVKLSGRAAEEIVFGDTCTGAQNDLETAAVLATKMVWEYGMSDELGPFAIGNKENAHYGTQPRISPETIRIADSAVRRIIDESYAKAKQILGDRRQDLDNIAQYLIAKETMEEGDLNKLIASA
jgi:cell division protease FtsH